jgi:hypothetical protein
MTTGQTCKSFGDWRFLGSAFDAVRALCQREGDEHGTPRKRALAEGTALKYARAGAIAAMGQDVSGKTPDVVTDHVARGFGLDRAHEDQVPSDGLRQPAAARC